MSDAIETQGMLFSIGNKDTPLTYTEIKEVISFSGFDGSASEIDTTNLQSTAKEFLMGLQDHGNFGMECNYLSADPGQVLLRAAKASRVIQDFKITWSDATTTTFQGYALSASRSGGVDSKVDTSFSIRITGDLTDA
ncbi:MAG: hypothetical protein HQL70_09650 [Magnetococcales bacterium]|nr:hypothetical protein [Magnetococcales bacterium]